MRWALDFKGIAHERRSLLPNMPRALLFSLRGTLPVLDLDGERIVDSTRIVQALEQRCPEPALYPADADERRRASELEDFFDENAGHEVRRAAFFELRHEQAYMAAFLTTGRGALTRQVYRALLSAPGSMAYANHRYQLNADAAERAAARLREVLDRLDAELQPSGYLVGSSFTIADLTAAALLFPLVWPAEVQYDYPDAPASPLRDALADHPSMAWVRRIYGAHRGASAEIPA